jgi:hypothetical protein
MNLVQVKHQNDHATKPLYVPVLVLPNTPEDVGDAQISANSRLKLPWLDEVDAHDGIAVICGGGPSIADCLDELHALHKSTATFFGLNGASAWLAKHGMPADYQLMLDAKQESAGLVDPAARHRLYASQVHPDTATHADCLFHLANLGIEDLMPPERVEAGGYTLIGGGVSVGITALCVAFTLGFREFHLFGYDSSNRDRATHAYSQPMNAFLPTCEVEWAGETYTASMPMKMQAQAFLRYAEAMEEEGAVIEVHGSGLLPAMWSIEPITEQEKYQRLWGRSDYRAYAPGEKIAKTFLEVAKPEGLVLDLGCGTGRGALKIAETNDVLLIDFTDNCRDKAAMKLPFVQWDLTHPLPVSAPYGFCTDVMEHIPPEDVDTVLANILSACDNVFFQIATVPDKFGSVIRQKLHLTVQPHEWWAAKLPNIRWQERTEYHSCFYISRNSSDE